MIGKAPDVKNGPGMPRDGKRIDRHLTMAQDYARAARAVAATGDTGLAFYHLVAHGLELALKTVLNTDGDNTYFLMLRGHRLASCYRDAVELGAVFDPDIEAVVMALDWPHNAQGFRYPSNLSNGELPAPRVAVEALHTVIAEVERVTLGVSSAHDV